ncbi:DNA-binding transcriptional regulator, LysR family [Andreprevotia lacus DSM 23236]|jgi:DNA-binding transcriptional LysR family regulator|uniref:DNA-binding transcriptional regulator, LysR family n=1 Tax=Andreprevotia lacus DSM 23236 TaxID=1121001 RepID=A0A1W1XSE5_9NEIS|nr:LysR family transcriptional regulator [Andreprevotia lacus]SMC26816.1 DNA-binding transcriptional regulator, LysR family [Andreprevotia lacus DSM 23236]
MQNGLLEHIRSFVAIADAGSMTRAAIVSGIAQTSLSRQLAALEQSLGCALLQRSTRALSLTEAGRNYLPLARRMLALADEAALAVQAPAQLQGVLRVACSNGFARHLLIPALPRWQRLHPQVELELLLSDRLSPLIEESADLAIRLGTLAPSALVSRPLGRVPRIVVATPAYLQQHGTPHSPAELQQHDCVVYTDSEQAGRWLFRQGDEETRVALRGRLRVSTVDAQYDAVLAHLGLAVMPAWFWARALLEGQVVQLLADYTLPEQAIQAVSAQRATNGSKARAFSDFVATLLPTASD